MEAPKERVGARVRRTYLAQILIPKIAPKITLKSTPEAIPKVAGP